MQFRARLDNLRPAVQWATRVVPDRPPLAVWAGLHIRVNGSSVVFTGGDGDVVLNAKSPCVNGIDGEAVIGARGFNEWLGALSSAGVDEIRVETNEDQRSVVCDAGAAHLYKFRMFSGTYPLPTRGEGLGHDVELDALSSALRAAQHATGTGEGPMGGVHVRSNDRRFTVTATDSYRMVRVRGNPGIGAFSGVLPHKAVSLIGKLKGPGRVWADDDGRSIEITTNGNAERTLLCHTVHGPFPSANHILDGAAEYRLNVSREELTGALLRVSPFSSKRGVVVLAGDGNTLSISATSEDVGEVVEQLRVNGNASHLNMGLNLTYLREAVNTFEGVTVTLLWNQTLGPLRITDEGEHIMELVMPVRV